MLLPALLVVFNHLYAQRVRLAFGSCSRQQSEGQLWNEVIQEKPDAWIWLGDNIYADTHNVDSLKAMYRRQKIRPAYQQLLQSMPVYGTWDDHDYGVNDGGRYFSGKVESKQALLDFLDVPATSDVRSREGVYQSYVVANGKLSVKIILLDTRYFRDTLMRSSQAGVRYKVNTTGDILGEAQWQWLERELLQSAAQINLIGSSIQYLAEDHGFEKWANFPVARQRMLEMLGRVKPKGVLFLSGDRHMAEISVMAVSGLSYPLVDVTSSGLTHTWTVGASELNRHRQGNLVAERNFGLLEFRRTRSATKATIRFIGVGGGRLAEHNFTY